MRLPLRNDRFAFLRAGEEIDPFDLNIGKHKGLERTIGCRNGEVIIRGNQITLGLRPERAVAFKELSASVESRWRVVGPE